MRSKLDEQLNILNKTMIEMGALCEQSLKRVNDNLSNGSEEIYQKVLACQQMIEQKQAQIQSMCLKLLLQQQPVATDLRVISAALKMIYDLNRIGIQATDIAEILRFLGKNNYNNLEILEKIANETNSMVKKSIDSYVKLDIIKAKEVVQYDDVVDNMFNQIKADLIKQVSADSINGEYLADVLMIAKYYEKISDHAVNIANWVIFSIVGE